MDVTDQDDGDVPDTQEVWQYGHLTMTWMMSLCNSFGFDFDAAHRPAARHLFHALNGTLSWITASMKSCRRRVAEGCDAPVQVDPGRRATSAEWLNCIKSRQQQLQRELSLESGQAITLANLHKLGRSVKFDPNTEKILGDAEASKLARPAYREPWKFPVKYLPG